MNILEMIDELIENGMSEDEAYEVVDFEINMNNYSDDPEEHYEF